MTRFFWHKQNRCRNPSQINHSLISGSPVGDLPERVLYPVRTVRYLRWAARSVEFTPSRLFVSPLDPTRTLSKNAMSFFLRQFITESGAVSSLVPQEPMTSKGLLLLCIIFNPSNSAITEAVPWKSSRVFAMRYPTDMSTTWSRPTGMGPLIAAGSAVHQHWVTGVCVSYLSPYTVMGLCLAFSLISNFPANPIQSLPFLDLFRSRWTLLLHVVLYGCV